MKEQDRQFEEILEESRELARRARELIEAEPELKFTEAIDRAFSEKLRESLH